jgi:signal transduction histidine kinase
VIAGVRLLGDRQGATLSPTSAVRDDDAGMRSLTEREGDVVATGLVAAVAALALVTVGLTVYVWSDLAAADAYPSLFSALAGVVYAAFGALIVRRTGNRFGWALEWTSIGLVLCTFLSVYAMAGMRTGGLPLPAPKLVGAFADPVFGATAIALAYLLFIFPTGSLPSPRWRPLVRVGLAAAAAAVLLMVAIPAREPLPAPGGVSLIYANPLRIRSAVLSTTLVVAVWIVVITVAAAFVSLVMRYRTGDRELRQQIKWLAFVAGAAFALQIGALISLVACQCDRPPIALGLLLTEAFVIFLGVPAALAIAILKYHLYDIDVILNRAVLYGILAAALTILYVGVVVGIGTFVGSRGSPALTIVAAAAIALLFQPLRSRAQRVANRLVYGDRATPYQVLSELADRMASTFSLDDVLEQTASVLAAGTGASRVDVWLRLGEELRPVAVWPSGSPPRPAMPLEDEHELPAFDGVTRVAAVRQGGELLGALTIEKPPSEPLTPTEDELVADLASQAGLALRNVRLTAELQASLEDLRASRRRLVEAQDHERRKIERNLHDGAQQQLVALSVQLGLVERIADDPERVRAMSAQIRAALGAALDDLRDLARGIYPPLLADKGLAAAIEAQARKAPLPTTVEADGVGRLPQDAEAAIYFCTLEALQNVAKYAGATSAVVRLRERNGGVEFEVEDDGQGFDPANSTAGTGLQGMLDRLNAIGGTLEIDSRPGRGTIVRGSVPRS